MLDPELCAASRILSPFGEESGDEDLSVLPRHTKVIVTGNNRTKSVLVGLQGVVKKAVGLGGWHWLVLKNGVEVKLQRNALSVLEPPTGNEEDDVNDFDNCSTGSDIATGFELSKLSKAKVRHTKPWIQSTSAKSTSRTSCKEIQSTVHTPKLRVNLSKLRTSSLWRYWKSFNHGSLSPNPPTREQMVNAVQQYFTSQQQQLDEVQVVVEFIHAAKRLKSVDRL